MTFKEYLEKNKYVVDNMVCESIDELKKIANEQNIIYSEEELHQAWEYIKRRNASEESDELDDDALSSVAGGKTIVYYQNCGNQTGCTTTIHDNSNNISIGKVNGNTNVNK